jgi:hypothetical protein
MDIEHILSIVLSNPVLDKGILVYLIVQNQNMRGEISTVKEKLKEIRTRMVEYKCPMGNNLTIDD